MSQEWKNRYAETNPLDILESWRADPQNEFDEVPEDLLEACKCYRNVIAITARKGDHAIAVVEIPRHKTADHTFCAWCRTQHRHTQGLTDDQILNANTEYGWIKLTVLSVT